MSESILLLSLDFKGIKERTTFTFRFKIHFLKYLITWTKRFGMNIKFDPDLYGQT